MNSDFIPCKLLVPRLSRARWMKLRGGFSMQASYRIFEREEGYMPLNSWNSSNDTEISMRLPNRPIIAAAHLTVAPLVSQGWYITLGS